MREIYCVTPAKYGSTHIYDTRHAVHVPGMLCDLYAEVYTLSLFWGNFEGLLCKN